MGEEEGFGHGLIRSMMGPMVQLLNICEISSSLKAHIPSTQILVDCHLPT